MALPNSENILSRLEKLPDAALKQMAMMHKADPYVLPLIISEDGRRKRTRQAAQSQMAMAQPKVADAAVDQMGIAQLPAPNIDGMADGGIAGYDDNDFDFAQRNEPVVRMSKGGPTKMSGAELFEKALDMEGITDPKERAFLKALHGQESSGKATAPTSNRDARGAMQILPGTFKQVADKDMDINKPLDNMRAGIRYGKKGFDAAGGDPVLAGAYYYGGPGGMKKAAQGVAVSDPKNPNAPDTVEYGKSIAQRMTAALPIGSAQAGTPQKQQAAAPADTSLASQIAGQRTPAPVSNYDQTNSFFGRMADKLGIPLEAQRQIGTTLNAPTPLAPVVGSVKSGSSGIVALGEKLGDKLGLLQGPKGRMSAAELAAAKNEQSGIKALEAAQQVTRDAQAAGATLEEQEYLRKMIEARRAAEGPSKAAQIAQASQAREAVDVATAQRLSKAGQQAQAAGRVNALADNALSPTATSAAAAAAAAPGYNPNKMEPVSSDEFGGMSEPVKDKVVETAKAVVPEKKGFSLSDEDYLSLGLRLMANKNPNFLVAAGESGLGALADKKEREKAATEKAYRESQTRYQSAYADALERGAKEKNLSFEAEKEVNDYMANWDKNNKMLVLQDPTARAREEQRIRAQVYASAGVKPIMSQQAAPAGGGGFKFLGVS
jgi:hypothetical protein